MSYISNKGAIDTGNTTTTPLAAAAIFTGTAKDASAFSSVVVSCKTDKLGTLYIEFSPDGTNWDSSLSFLVAVDTNEVHRLSVSKKYMRVRFENTDSAIQTYIRLQTLLGNQTLLTSSLNSVIQSDADALAVRPLDFNLMVAEGLYQNRQSTIKDGLNEDIDTGSTPEDITNEGGVYAGFPTGAVEAAELIVAGADTGTVYYTYLASNTSTDYVLASKAITGAGTYALGHNIYRCNFMYFVSTTVTVFNVGLLTIRNNPSTANVFVQIPIGYSQSYCSGYTVPYGSSVYIDRFQGNVKGSASGSLDGFIWYRPFGESPRLRFPFELQFGTLYFDDVDYLLKIPERVDFIPRIITASANNLSAKFSYRLIKIKS